MGDFGKNWEIKCKDNSPKSGDSQENRKGWNVCILRIKLILIQVELDDGSDDSDDSSDESNRSPIQRPTAEVKSEPVVLASLPGSLAGQHGDPKRHVLSKVHCTCILLLIDISIVQVSVKPGTPRNHPGTLNGCI